LPLSEKVRVEIFIPDLPDPAYSRLADELGDELSYAFGGCTTMQGSGKYRADDGPILPDRVNVLSLIRLFAGKLIASRLSDTQTLFEA
jgi:hypothetical protein